MNDFKERITVRPPIAKYNRFFVLLNKKKHRKISRPRLYQNFPKKTTTTGLMYGMNKI